MPIILAIDCGTTSTRVIAFKDPNTILSVAQKPLPISHPNLGWAEQDPSLMWQLTRTCLDQVISRVGASNVHAIGITNQRETAIAWQKSSGKPIAPAISWQCRRTKSRCNDLLPYASMIKEKTGLPMDPYFSATKFEWLLQTHHRAQSLLENDDLCFGTVDAWLLFNLTNGAFFSTDVTNASRTMLFNINTCRYDPELCELFNIPISALPNVYPSVHDFGHYKMDDVSIPIRSIIGDQQSALFAQCGLGVGQIKNTYGTGLFIMTNTGSQVVNTADLISTIAIGLNGKSYYALEGSIFTEGSLIQWLRDQLGLVDSVDETESLASSVKDNGGVCIVPALSGLGAPHWLPTATGSIFGLTRSTKKAHIIRAALESIALQSNDVIDLMKRECANIRFDTLMVDGGASANAWLMQLQADVSNLTVRRPNVIEATALGAALTSACYDNVWDASSSPSLIEYESKNDMSNLLAQWKLTIDQFKQGVIDDNA